MPLTYRQVSDLYDAAPRQQSFPDWAANMDQLVGGGSTQYSDAAHDPFKVKAVSTGIDKLLEATGIPTVTEKLGGAVGSLVGDEEAGARIGHGLPRATVNFAPLLALSAVQPEVGLPLLTAGALGTSAGLTGAETYTETGSPTAGVVSGATAAIMPGVTSAVERKAGQYALEKLGGRLVAGDTVDEAGRIAAQHQWFPTTAAQKAISSTAAYGAGQVAAAGVSETGTLAQEKLTGQPLSNPFSTDNLLNLTLGQAPFALIHATSSVMGRSGKTPMQQADLLQLAIDKSEPAILAHQAEQERRNQPDVTVIPEVKQEDTTPEVQAQIESALARVRGNQLDIKNDPNIPEDQKIKLLNDESEREYQLLQKKAPTPQSVFGNTIVPDVTQRQELVGRQVWVNALGTARRILVAEDPANPPELWNQVIGYSTKDEPAPKFGLQTPETQVGGGPNTGLGTFSLPVGWQSTPKPAYEYFANQKSPETKRTAEQVKAEGSTIDPAVEPLVKALNGKNVITTGSDERSVTVENAHIDESKLPANWRYDPDTGTITKAATVTDQGPVRPEEIQPIVNAITPFPRQKVTTDMGQPDLPVNPDPMTKEQLDAHLHELDKVIVAATAAQTPLDGQLAVVDLQDQQAGHDLPITDDTTLKPIMASIADKDVIDPNKVPQAAVVVAANLTKAQLKAKQKALNDLLSSQARGEEQPDTFESLPGKAEQAEIANVTELMGGGERFSVRKLGNLNKLVEAPSNIMTDELVNIAVEEVSKGVDALKVFKKWNIDEDGEEKSTFKKDAKDFFDVINNFDDLAHLPYEKVAEFLNARNLSTKWNEYEVRSFMIRPHVQMWLKAMDDNVGKKFEANAARIPVETLYHGTQLPVQKFVAGRPVYLTSDIEAAKSYARSSERASEGARVPPREGQPTVLKVGADFQNVAKTEDVENVIKDLGVRDSVDDVLFGTSMDSEKVFNELTKRGYDAVNYYDQNAETGDVIPAMISLKPEGLTVTGQVSPAHTPTPLPPGVSEGTESFTDKTGVEHTSQVMTDATTGSKLSYYTFNDPVTGKPLALKISRADTPVTGQRQGGAMRLIQALQQKADQLGLPIRSGFANEQSTPLLEKLGFRPAKEQGTQGTETPGEYIYDPKPAISPTQDVAAGPRWLSEPNYAPTTPSEVHYATQFGLDENGRGNGLGIINYLKNHDNSFYRALGTDLEKLGPDSLARVIVQLKQAEGSYLRQNQNGTSEITLAANVLNGSSDSHANTLAHELIHGLTANEMDNPTKQHIVVELNKLRQRLVDQLPDNVKPLFKQLYQAGWYAKYANNEVGPDMNEFLGLMGNEKLTEAEQGILYGLMSTKEMVAQGMSNSSFQTYMQKISAPQGQNVFSRMANFVKEILGIGGKVSGTEFETFLARTDQLIEAGNYVSSFKNFTDSYFERLGQTGDTVDTNTKRAMSLINDSVFGTSPADILFQVRMGAMVSNPEVAETSQALQQMIQLKGEAYDGLMSILKEQGYPDQINSMLDSMLLGEVPNHGDVMDTLPPEAANYIFAYARDAKMILGSIQEATMKANAGLLNIADPKLISGPVAESLKLVDNVLKYEKEHQVAQQNIDSLEGIPPSGFVTNVVQNPEILPAWAMGADKTKDKEAWLHTFLEPVARWARRIPEVAEVVSKGWELTANSRKMATEALKAFGTDLQTMSMSQASVKLMEKMLGNSKLTRAADQWIYTNQKVGQEKESVKMLDADHPDIAKILAPLSPTERDQAQELVQKHQISQQQMQAQILEKQLQIASTRGAELTGLPMRQGIKLSSTLLEALRADRSNPVSAAAADAQIHSVQMGMQPEQFLNLLKFSEAAINEWKAVQDFYQKNPAWSSGQRYGKFLVSYTRGKKSYLAGVDSKKEAQKLTEGATNIVFKKNQKSEGDSPPNLGPDAPGMVQKLREFQQTQYDMMLNSGRFNQDDIAFMKSTSPTEQLITEEAYRGGVPGLRPEARGLTRGAEELPWLRNHFSWVKKTATYQSRQLLRAQVHAHLLDPEIAANPEMQAKLQTHFDNMLQPDTQIGHTFQRAAMNWFMGFNPASALVNATQPFLTHTAEFTSMTGKPVDSYRRTIGALNDIRKYFQSGKKSWGDPDLDWAMHKATQDGEIDLAMFDDDPATQETIHTNFKRIMDGNKSQTLGQRLGTMAGSWSTAGMWMFRGVERFNTQAAILSSFKYYTEQGLGREQALEKAYQFNRAVNYGGGAAGRPVGVFSGRGAFPRTAAMLSTSMQSYVLGTTYQLAHYIQKGYFRPAGLAPAEVYAARKAAVQMLGVQLASAGVLGMPFVSGAVAVLNQLFPDLEVRKHLQEWMNDLLGGDNENGSILSDAAMMGVPSMFGWDLQSRLSMGNTIPGVSEINGFDPSTLMGAPINMISTFVKGGKQLAQGDVTGIDQFVPPALKKIEQYVRQGGIATDYRDRPVFTPTKGEVAGMALGFQPRRTTDFNTASRIAKQAQDNIIRRSGEFHQQMGEQILKGNFGNVRAELQKRMREDPKFDPASAVRSIAQTAEDLTFPRDLRREGSVPASDVRARLLRTFNLPPSQPDESTRLQFRQGVERRLGLQVSTGSDLRLAQVMDQLRRQSPEATRSDLRRQAERLLRSPRQQTFSSPQE